MEERPLSEIFKELVASMAGLIRSEMNLAKTELKQNMRDLVQRLVKVAIFAVVGWLGVLALLACAVVALGNLLNGNYALSALIVGLVLVVPSAIMIFQALKNIGNDLAFPVVKHSLREDRELIQDRLQNISDLRKERIA